MIAKISVFGIPIQVGEKSGLVTVAGIKSKVANPLSSIPDYFTILIRY